MATGFGIPEIKVAEATGTEPAVYQGTTAQDIQRITAAQYQNAGILTGCKVMLRADWKVLITAGGVIVDLGSDLAAAVPVYEQAMALQPAPAVGERVDTIYVQQVATASDNLAKVAITSGSAPVNSIILDKLRVTAGATKTNQLTSAWDRRYARSSQSSQGRISSAVDSRNTVRTEGPYKACSQRFYVDTDRHVNLKLSVTARRCKPNGDSIYPYHESIGSVIYRVFIDNTLVRSFEVMVTGLSSTTQLETMHEVAMGAHTVHIESQAGSKGSQPDIGWQIMYGGTNKYNGDSLTVFDAGVAV